MMRVFARYFTENGLDFRLNTVLQFGDSWLVIGAAVLINPGSAKPICCVGDEELSQLSKISEGDYSWYEFSPDSTMRQLEKIFGGWYAGEEKPLGGIILLFNLFNLRDQKLETALAKQKECKSRYLFINEKDIELIKGMDKVYLGWGNVGKLDGNLRPIAESIFSSLYPGLKYYLKENFEDNAFYHPGYINRSYKRSVRTKEIIKAFHQG